MICFTLDDGYADNLTHALPIFERWQIPFTVYVVVAYIQRSLFPWWLALEDLIRQGEGFILGSTFYRPIAWHQRSKLFLQLKAELIQKLPEEACAIVEESLRKAGIDPQPYYQAMLSWEELKRLASNPLCSIGAHTLTHPYLSALPEARAWQEISQSKSLLEQNLGIPVRHFAYPYGSPNTFSMREVKMVEGAGYLSAVTTTAGNLYPEHRALCYCLPRRKVFEGTRVVDFYRPRRHRIARLCPSQ
ncbi:MAG: polysaccharide deacetylase family protein [Bacteroidia bacterium]|nr:polysaccharide deacetylase family protein [Bacteroidia bacterium]